jgi:hypothetical protein
MNDQLYLAFMLAMSDQLTDLQNNGSTYPDGKVMWKAYTQVMSLISRLKQNPEVRLTPYNGEWHTKEEIDKMFYRDIF